MGLTVKIRKNRFGDPSVMLDGESICIRESSFVGETER